MSKRTLNRCHKCKSTWYPRGQDLSPICPRCKSHQTEYCPAPDNAYVECVKCTRSMHYEDDERCLYCGHRQLRHFEEHCRACDEIIERGVELCPHCGERLLVRIRVERKTRYIGVDRRGIFLFALLLGWAGTHRLYMEDEEWKNYLYISLFTFGIGAPFVYAFSVIESLFYLVIPERYFHETHVEYKWVAAPPGGLPDEEIESHRRNAMGWVVNSTAVAFLVLVVVFIAGVIYGLLEPSDTRSYDNTHKTDNVVSARKPEVRVEKRKPTPYRNPRHCNLWVRKNGKSVVWRKTKASDTVQILYRGKSSTKVRVAGKKAWISNKCLGKR